MQTTNSITYNIYKRMRNTFTLSLLAAAVTRAQLYRECFYVTEMHGVRDTEDGDLLSDLPTLMAMYKPGMRLDSVVALQDALDDDMLTGIKFNLRSQRDYSTLELTTVGAWVDEWDSQKIQYTNQQPDRISILADDTTGYICDVIFYQGRQKQSLSKDNSECIAELTGITETMIRLPEQTPLVGLHGLADGQGLMSLGLIMVDTQDHNC